MKKLTLEEFIKKAILKHGNKYDYSLSVYIDIRTKLKIICKYHGIFEQKPNAHLNGMKCHKCAGTKKLNTIEFIKKAIEKHGLKYTYDKTNYVTTNEKVIITCKIHGDFEQTPHSHLKSRGCFECFGDKLLTTKEFIINANLIHNNKYDYSLTNYVNNHVKVIIICKEHGAFKQMPYSHIQYVGCPKCNSSRGELKTEKLLLENNIIFENQFSFPDLKYKRKLKFDFSIFNKNGDLLCLIEYNGIQHYQFTKNLHKTIEKYQESIFKDNLKTNYCLSNNILLFIIKYDEDIELKFKEILIHINNLSIEV